MNSTHSICSKFYEEPIGIRLTEQRERFTQLLKRAKLSHVIDLLDIIETRLEVISELKRIVYDPDVSRFANERDHIQKIVEKHYWLFGDQYSLASADITIKKTLQKFENVLQEKKKMEPRYLTKNCASGWMLFYMVQG